MWVDWDLYHGRVGMDMEIDMSNNSMVVLDVNLLSVSACMSEV